MSWPEYFSFRLIVMKMVLMSLQLDLKTVVKAVYISIVVLKMPITDNFHRFLPQR